MSLDICISFQKVCQLFLNKINCPNQLKTIQSCNSISLPNYPQGQIQDFIGQCSCGNIIVGNIRTYESIIDSLIMEKINREYLYLPSPIAPYSLIISSNPFKQFLYPSNGNIPN